MKKRIYSMIVLTTVLAMLLVLPASGAQTSTDQQIALEIAALINGYRNEKGLYQYVYNSTIESVAQKHTAYQVSIEESTHYGPGRNTSKDRVTASGYGGGKYLFVSEIIYHGQFATPKAALQWWKNSPIHNEQMLSTQYHEFGVAVGRSDTYIYYTVNFAAIKGVTAPGVGSAPSVSTLQVSAPVTVAEPNQDGSIVHFVEEGQTIQGVAEAYQVQLDQLLLFNGISESSALTAGQLILVKLPVSQAAVTVEPNQSKPEPTQLPEPTQAEESEQGIQPTAPGEAAEPEPSEIPAGAGGTAEKSSNTLVILLVAVVVVAAVGFAVFSFLRLRKSVEEEEIEGGPGQPAGDGDLSEFQLRSRAQQFELLREVAEMALDAYPLEVVTIEPTQYALNAEFSVEARQRDGAGGLQHFSLRVNAPGFHSKSEIGSEMEWLAALRQETDLQVPSPVQTSSGDWVQTVLLALVGEPRHCVLFRRQPGQPLELPAAPENFAPLGAAIAQLHAHGAGFSLPSGFVRKHWDLEGLSGGMLDVPANQAFSALTDEEGKVVEAAGKLVAAAIEKLGRTDQVYGLIHGDLHLGSFQVKEGELQILDFDTCGYGYYIYDLAVLVSNIFEEENFASLKTALLHGYRSHRQLSEQEEKLLMHFVAGRLMTETLAWAGRRHDPSLAGAANKGIEKQVFKLVALIRMLVA